MIIKSNLPKFHIIYEKKNIFLGQNKLPFKNFVSLIIKTKNRYNCDNCNKKSLIFFQISKKNISGFHNPIDLPKKDLYKILGINSTSDIKEIKQAYYKKAKELHPDKFESKLLWSYRVISFNEI